MFTLPLSISSHPPLLLNTLLNSPLCCAPCKQVVAFNLCANRLAFMAVVLAGLLVVQQLALWLWRWLFRRFKLALVAQLVFPRTLLMFLMFTVGEHSTRSMMVPAPFSMSRWHQTGKAWMGKVACSRSA